jgi:hypothetical protein
MHRRLGESVSAASLRVGQEISGADARILDVTAGRVEGSRLAPD